jgi:cytochrome c-type biogenesis protein CcmH
MTLWVVLALMTAAAVLAVLWPLARGERKLRSGSDLAVYRDQLEELQRDRAAGLIGESEAEAAQVEVSRRLIAAADAEAATPRAAPPPTVARRRRSIAAAALVMVPLGASALYIALGSPSLPGQPLASRVAAENLSVENMIERIEAHLAKEPNDGRGWELIAPIYLRLGRFDDAIKARRNALALNGETAERQSGLGEALAGAANGTVTAEAKAAFERAVALDAKNVRGRYYLGLAAEQDGRPADAATIYRAMLAGAPADAPWVEFIRTELARLGGGRSGDELAAGGGLAPDQLVMIRGMVAGLAERLQKDGSDLDGWLRLMQSYMVLGERDKARAAVDDARRAVASEPEKLRRINERAKELGLQG